MAKQKIDARPAVFIDRDGVLNEDLGYVYRPQDLIIPSGVSEALLLLKERNYLLIVVTNQSGVARGLYTEQDVTAFHDAMQARLAESGVTLDRFYVCPHHPKGKVASYVRDCACRKPGIGLIEQASEDFAIDLPRSVMIGDKASDIDCGKNAGLKTIQVTGGRYERHPGADHYAPSLMAAVQWLLRPR